MENEKRRSYTNLRHTLNKKIDQQTKSVSSRQSQDGMRELQMQILVPLVYAIFGIISYIWGQTFIVEESHPF